MRTAQDVVQRISNLEEAKQCLLFPPIMAAPGARTIMQDERLSKQATLTASGQITLESLNAEIAALTWVLNNEVVQGEQRADGVSLDLRRVLQQILEVSSGVKSDADFELSEVHDIAEKALAGGGEMTPLEATEGLAAASNIGMAAAKHVAEQGVPK